MKKVIYSLLQQKSQKIRIKTKIYSLSPLQCVRRCTLGGEPKLLNEEWGVKGK